MSDNYTRSKALGRCYICKEAPSGPPGTATMCRPCADQHALEQRIRVTEAAAHGRCAKCFTRPRAPRSRYCVLCLERSAYATGQRPPLPQEERSARVGWHTVRNRPAVPVPVPPPPPEASAAAQGGKADVPSGRASLDPLALLKKQLGIHGEEDG